MKCIRCEKDTFESMTTEAIELECGLLVIRNIPCYKCVECDEICYTGDVAARIERITEMVTGPMREITVVDFQRAS
jgi:YgiT-type zinc finger domain-containing protein